MRGLKKIFSGALAIMIAFSFASCAKRNNTVDADKPNEVITDVQNAPDYSSSAKKLNMYAYVGPTNGKYTLANGTKITLNDFRTEERYREYRDCGFDTLLLLGNDGYSGAGDWNKSDLKMNLDLCESVGLNCIVFDFRIHDLSARTDSLIGTGSGQYSDADALAGYLKGLMSDYYEHAAFYGVSIKDEPTYVNLPAIGDLYAAFRIINGERKEKGLTELYINTVMLPYRNGSNNFSADKSLGSKKAYRDYVQTYFNLTDADAFDYDAYPFKFTTSNDCANDPQDSYIETQYLSNMQLVSQEASALGKSFYMTMQCHASTAGAANSSSKRQMEIADFRWQLNTAFAFGAKDLRYYTYWTFPRHTGDPMDYAIMSDSGEKQYYDMVRTTNAEAQKQAKVVLNFDYVQTALVMPRERLDKLKHFAGITEAENMGVGIESNCGTVLNEMVDKAENCKGYYVFNAEDPAANMTAKVKLKFDGYKYAAVYNGGERTLYKLNDSVLNLQFDKGEGAFVIPFN